jgi:hypothetical protein
VAEVPLEKLRDKAKKLQEAWQNQENLDMRRFKAELTGQGFSEEEAERAISVTPQDSTGKALQREFLQTAVNLLPRPT